MSILKKIIIFIYFLPLFDFAYTQVKVQFNASDSLEVVADQYYSGNKSDRFVIFFHQAGSSRGEYKDIAPKLKNLDYNCLVVDLRAGDEMNFINNETAKNAENKNLSRTFLDAKKDVLAAIDYAYKQNSKRVILVGSSYSASLALLVAKENPKVQAVIAFSPGEYFRPSISVKNELKGFDKPVFVYANYREYEYVKDLIKDIPADNKQLYTPGRGEAPHGAKALWDNYPGSKDIWLSLMMFFNEVKKDIFY